MMSRTTLRSGSAQSRQPNCVGPRPVSCHHPSQVNFLPFSTVWACQWALQNLLTYLRVVSARHQTVLNWTRVWTAASALVPAIILYPRYQTLLIMLMTHYFQAVMKNPCHVLYHYFLQVTRIKPIISGNAQITKAWPRMQKPFNFL